MINEIEKHFSECYPREGCGVVVSANRFIPCTNVASDKDDFIIDSKEYITISKKHKILAIVHSHPDAPNTPSHADIVNCNAVQIPFHIYSYPDMGLHILNPSSTSKLPLEGRHYKFGTFDCFEASRDYYIKEGLTILPRLPFEDDWWLKGLDYFSTELIARWGFIKVDTLQKNDLLIFKIGADIANHCGVYTGNDMFYHHAFNRLSVIENLYPLWKKYLVGIYRHEP